MFSGWQRVERIGVGHVQGCEVTQIASEHHEVVGDGNGGNSDVREAWTAAFSQDSIAETPGGASSSGVKWQDAVAIAGEHGIKPSRKAIRASTRALTAQLAYARLDFSDCDRRKEQSICLVAQPTREGRRQGWSVRRQDRQH